MAGAPKKKRRSNINEVQPQFTYLCIGNSIDWHQPQTDPTFLFQTMFSFLLQAQQTFFLFVLFQQLALPLVMLQGNNQTFIVGVVVIKQRNNSINKKEQTRVISTTALQLPYSDPSPPFTSWPVVQ